MDNITNNSRKGERRLRRIDFTQPRILLASRNGHHNVIALHMKLGGQFNQGIARQTQRTGWILEAERLKHDGA